MNDLTPLPTRIKALTSYMVVPLLVLRDVTTRAAMQRTGYDQLWQMKSRPKGLEHGLETSTIVSKLEQCVTDDINR
jgi:hypothetical protein